MYARLKKLSLDKIIVTLNINEKNEINKKIKLLGNLSQQEKIKLLQISSRCPIQKILNKNNKIISEIVEDNT
jgi:putative redox protein